MASFKLTVEAVVLDRISPVLLVKQGRKRHDWELPGGHVKKGESLVDALVREVREETGLTVKPERLLGVYQIRQEKIVDFVFVCRLVGRARAPKPRPPEIVACGFFAADALPKPVRRFTAARIKEALAGVTQKLPVELKPGCWLGKGK